jgi:nucleotide-binding universal stress UspA family protein
MKILIGVDGSSSSDVAIQKAAHRPWPKGSEFRVLTVLDPYFFTRAPLLLEESRASTLEGLKAQAKPLAEAGWAVEYDVMLDHARHGLPRAASAWGADLVMLGSHGRSAVERLLLGSTAQAVLRHATCSVEIVRAREGEKSAQEGMCVVIPTDGSEFAELAVRVAAEQPWPSGSTFKIVSCPEYPVLVGEYAYFPTEKLTELLKASTDQAGISAMRGEQLLKEAGLKASCEITEPKDTPAAAILDAAEEWKADLIVMGSHGRRGFDRLVLGSVSETVALHAACSVEVVRQAGLAA